MEKYLLHALDQSNSPGHATEVTRSIARFLGSSPVLKQATGSVPLFL